HHPVVELQADDRRAVCEGKRLRTGAVGRGLGAVRFGAVFGEGVHEARGHAEPAATAGQGQLGRAGHSPPFCTYDLMNSSAFSSTTESISSRIASISSLRASPLPEVWTCPPSSPSREPDPPSRFWVLRCSCSCGTRAPSPPGRTSSARTNRIAIL